MSDVENPNMVVKSDIAKPLHYQILEKSLDIEPFLTYVEKYLQDLSGDDGDVSSNSEEELVEVNTITGETIWNGVAATREDRRLDRERYFNLSKVRENRRWLRDVLVTDSSESSSDEEVTEEDLKHMLREHLMRKKYKRKFLQNSQHHQYQYYSAGLLSNYDKFPEHQADVLGVSRKKKGSSGTSKRDRSARHSNDSDTNQDHDSQELDGKDDDASMSEVFKPFSSSKKKKSHKKKSRTAEIMAAKRRKIWSNMAKKEVGKIHRSKISNHKEVLTQCRKVANYCMRYWRQKAMQSQKNMKEIVWRTKRLSKEMQTYWKRYERVERETRKRIIKEAEEQRKLDLELMEKKRQQRKLNFLITQTELYAHFMSKKLLGASEEEQLRILSQLEEEKNPRLVPFDDYDPEAEKERILRGVERSVEAEAARAKEFGLMVPLSSSSPSGEEHPSISSNTPKPEEDKPQPDMFQGNLKPYQRKGMTWLVNLYDQGLNGILADEMGLGKTVQSIAFLCHIAEKYMVWGPFLIICPASTLHNWQQEMAKFAPEFKVEPYWGNPQDRKILRRCWDQRALHTKDASFHVVITSYQIVITDIQYFNRIKWQYMILDEAQAIKSSSSQRWKVLLGFNCRNRLLLSGTPIQNSMAELWALLHFIMPTMFDSHDEFNEWFSKDIESHAENKTGIDEKHLSRLHLILKPFMLRRVKADVENDIGDKVEIMLYCPLTTRQQKLYSALKMKISIEDLLYSSGSVAQQSSQSITSNLMNLVVQFRKVCNHPELFERREPRSPFIMRSEDYCLPKLIVEEAVLDNSFLLKKHIIYNLLSPFSPYNIHSDIFHSESSEKCFGFTRLINLSPSELNKIALFGLFYRWLHLAKLISSRHGGSSHPSRPSIISELPELPSDLTFTSYTTTFNSFQTVIIYPTPETLDHRIIRTKKALMRNEINVDGIVALPESSNIDDKILKLLPQDANTSLSLLEEFQHVARDPKILECWPVSLPSFVYHYVCKVGSLGRQMYAVSRRWVWKWTDDLECGSPEGKACLVHGSPELALLKHTPAFNPVTGGLYASTPLHGWSNVFIPDKQTLVTDAGKLTVLDTILKKLKEEGHRVLIFSQMTRMIDILEEYMWFRKHTYMRLDGSSKISERRDMVADFQNRADIFVFLLSTRAGGLGINLTAADTVIFYDSDWNPTVDQQAMDRAHRLGQTKKVTVYRLICKGTIEERMLQRATEKSEIQRMVITGGNFRPDALKTQEVVSLLLDDAEIEQKYRQKQAEKRLADEAREKENARERKRRKDNQYKDTVKYMKTEDGDYVEVYQLEAPESQNPSEAGDEEGGSSLCPSPQGSSQSANDRSLNSGGRGKRGRPPRQGNSRTYPLPNMPPIALSSVSLRRGSSAGAGRPRGRGRVPRRGSSGRGRGRPPSKTFQPSTSNAFL